MTFINFKVEGPNARAVQSPFPGRARAESKPVSRFTPVCIRVIGYCPPIDLGRGELLGAAITADYNLVPNGPAGCHEALIDTFGKTQIYPRNVSDFSEDSLLLRARVSLVLGIASAIRSGPGGLRPSVPQVVREVVRTGARGRPGSAETRSVRREFSRSARRAGRGLKVGPFSIRWQKLRREERSSPPGSRGSILSAARL